ncbi:MAG: hypothetical protein ACRC6G_02295 [Deefgea sp.]
MKKIKNLFETLNKKLDGEVSDDTVRQVAEQQHPITKADENTPAIDRLFELPLSPVVNVASKGLAGLRHAVGKIKEMGSREVDVPAHESARIEPELDPLFAHRRTATAPTTEVARPEKPVEPLSHSHHPVLDTSASAVKFAGQAAPVGARTLHPTEPAISPNSITKQSASIEERVERTPVTSEAAASATAYSPMPRHRELPTIDLQQIQANLAISQRKLAAEGAKMPSKAAPVQLPIIDASEIRSRLQEIHAKPTPVEYPKRTALPETRVAQKSIVATMVTAKNPSLGVKPPLAPPVMMIGADL